MTQDNILSKLSKDSHFDFAEFQKEAIQKLKSGQALLPEFQANFAHYTPNLLVRSHLP